MRKFLVLILLFSFSSIVAETDNYNNLERTIKDAELKEAFNLLEKVDFSKDSSFKENSFKLVSDAVMWAINGKMFLGKEKQKLFKNEAEKLAIKLIEEGASVYEGEKATGERPSVFSIAADFCEFDIFKKMYDKMSEKGKNDAQDLMKDLFCYANLKDDDTYEPCFYNPFYLASANCYTKNLNCYNKNDNFFKNNSSPLSDFMKFYSDLGIEDKIDNGVYYINDMIGIKQSLLTEKYIDVPNKRKKERKENRIKRKINKLESKKIKANNVFQKLQSIACRFSNDIIDPGSFVWYLSYKKQKNVKNFTPEKIDSNPRFIENVEE